MCKDVAPNRSVYKQFICKECANKRSLLIGFVRNRQPLSANGQAERFLGLEAGK